MPGTTYRLRLKAGQHIYADRSRPVLGPDGKPTGRFEAVAVGKGGAFDSPVNLAAREPGRYELIGGEAASDAARIAALEEELAALKAAGAGAGAGAGDPAAVAPGGQVSSGFQKAVGRQGSAPMTAEEAAKAGGKTGLDAEGFDAGEPDDYGDGLDAMTLAELRETAEAEGVELHGAHRKADVAAAIRAHRAG